MSIIEKYKEFPDHIWLQIYRRRIPKLVAQMRAKEKIRVLFILHCLDKWKTESLFQAMLKHERFEPIIGLALLLPDYPSEAIKKFKILKEYIVNKRYNYQEIYNKEDIKQIAPDIIFYVEPYNGVINRGLEYRNARNSLFCFATYALHAVEYDWSYATIFYKFLWQEYYESELAARNVFKICPSRKNNIVFSGMPFSDQLLTKPETNPWKAQSNKKLRIIYAPHHTIVDPKDESKFFCGTFLQFGEQMLNLAQKYADKVQWAFKPHPCLFRELSYQWGEEKTLDYYNRWAEMDNSQFEEGQYIDLFKNSDAMIHDCGSFICEYLFMQKPVLYLDNGHSFSLNHLGREGLAQHYHASTKNQIEEFIQNVINGIDPMKESRTKFFKENLLPPNGKTASENIIDAILGE